MEQTPSDTSASNDPSSKSPEPQKKRSPRRLTEGVSNHNAKFTYEEQVRIVQAIAIYENEKDFLEKFYQDTGKKLTRINMNHYRSYPAWQPMIEKFREEFEAKIADEPLSSKRRRIQELSRAYARLERKDTTLSKAVDVLSRIREEIEGKASGGMSLTQYNQYNGLSDEDLRRVIDENSRFLQIAEKRKQIEIEATSGEGT